MSNIEELQEDLKKANEDFERLREQIIGVQYIKNYIETKIKELKEKSKEKK